jgi:adenosylcobinamide-phosphate synthase
MDLDSFWQMLEQSALHQPLLAVVVLLFSRFAPLPASYQPWFFIRAVANAIRAKVAKPSNDPQQQYLAGALATLVMLVPFAVLLIAFEELSAWPEFFQAFLLYLSLDWQFYANQIRQVSQSIEKQQTSLARDQLSSLVLRKTDKLSNAGIAKAALDATAFRLSKHWFGVLFWYLVGGGIAACSYRLLLELQQQWNPKLLRQREFGFFVSIVERVFSALPLLGNTLLLALWVNIRDTLTFHKYSQDRQLSFTSRWLLSAWAAALKCSVAGPIYYENEKVQRVRIGPDTQPTAAHLLKALTIATQLQRVAILLVFGLVALRVAAL